jgi:hypothetical protein
MLCTAEEIVLFGTLNQILLAYIRAGISSDESLGTEAGVVSVSDCGLKTEFVIV